MLPRAPLYTERLCLRPYEPADADDFFALLHTNRARLQSSFPDRLQAVRGPADAVAALRVFAEDWRTGRFYVFGIWHRATAEYVGDICLMPQHKGQAEIGYYLGAAAEGYGYAREALLATIDFGFGTVGSQGLLIRCYADNERGQAVARAAGFALDAAPKRAVWFRNADTVANIRRFVLARNEDEAANT